MKVACLLITHLRAKAEMQRRPHLADQPALIVDRSKPRPVVVDHFPAATAVSEGMPLEQALSHQAESPSTGSGQAPFREGKGRTGAVVLEADESHYRRVFRQILRSLQGIADQVEDAGLGTVYVSMDGLEAMYGGEERLVCTLLNAVPPHLQPRAGIGEGKFPALVAARISEPLRATKVPQDAAAFLAPRPIGHLPVSNEIISSLRRFGLHAICHINSMTQDQMIDQFGSVGGWIWNLANGHDERPLIPIEYEETVIEETSLPFSSTSLEMLLVATDTLLRRAYARPAMRGRYARRAALECPVFGAGPWEKAVNFQEGVGRWERASFIVRSKLEAEPPEVPVDGVALTLSGFTGESGSQLGMLPDVRENRRSQLMEAEQRLQMRSQGRHAARYRSVPAVKTGERHPGEAVETVEAATWPSLYRVVEVAPWHPAPEMRAVQTPLDPLSGGLRTLMAPEQVEVKEDRNRRPETVKLGEKWRRVTRIEDSWTFDLWWLPRPLTRAYYRVEREDGGQVTLFRDQHDDRWYKQGR